MKPTKKQEKLHSEILDCYNTEMVAINELFKAIGKVDHKIAKALLTLQTNNAKRESLIEEYSEYMKVSGQSEDVQESLLADFQEVEEEYHNNIENFIGYSERVRNSMIHISSKLQKSSSLLSAFKKDKLSLRERIDLWAKSTRLTYNEIYSA